MTSGAQAVSSTLSYGQLEQLWTQAGGNPQMAPLMAAIAMVESGGNPQASNPSGATGLWQIEWPLHAGVAGTTSQSQLYDPLTNAQAAVALSGNNPSTAPGNPVYDTWLEWEPPGAYMSYLNGSTASSSSTAQSSSGSQLTSASQLGSASMQQLLTAGMETYAGQHPGEFGFPTATLDAVHKRTYSGWRAYGLYRPTAQAVGFHFLFVNITFIQQSTVRKFAGIGIAVVGAFLLLVGLSMTLKAVAEGGGVLAGAIDKVPGVQHFASKVSSFGTGTLGLGGAGGEGAGAAEGGMASITSIAPEAALAA